MSDRDSTDFGVQLGKQLRIELHCVNATYNNRRRNGQ